MATSTYSSFEKTNKYMPKTEWEVVILDMGDDNCILVQKGPEYEVALDMYSQIDVSMVEIPTVVSLTKEAFKFVQDTIGRIFASTAVSDRLIQDVRVTAMTFDAQNFWRSPHVRGKDFSLSESSYPVALDTVAPFCASNYQADVEMEKSHILFNSMYNLSIVVDALKFGVCSSGLEGFLKAFPEFELAAKDVSNHTNLKTVFHRRSFESLGDVKTKYEAFECLYGAPKEKEWPHTSMNSEKVLVSKLLTDNYDLSDSIDDRIKASELYTDIANMYLSFTRHASNSAFKKRIAGYLVEHALKKKRFSDAYYYYGIRRKIKEKIQTLQNKMKHLFFDDNINVSH